MAGERRRTRGPAADTRDRVVAGAVTCLREQGVQGTTVAAVSRASGLSRPTIYAHFETLDVLVHAAVEQSALDLARRIRGSLDLDAPAADQIVEFVLAAHREFSADPVAALVVDMTTRPSLASAGTISEEMVEFTAVPMRTALAGHPDQLARLDEVVETTLRFLLSLLTYSSAVTRDEESLRGYLRRTLVPALGLTWP